MGNLAGKRIFINILLHRIAREEIRPGLEKDEKKALQLAKRVVTALGRNIEDQIKREREARKHENIVLSRKDSRAIFQTLRYMGTTVVPEELLTAIEEFFKKFPSEKFPTAQVDDSHFQSYLKDDAAQDDAIRNVLNEYECPVDSVFDKVSSFPYCQARTRLEGDTIKNIPEINNLWGLEMDIKRLEGLRDKKFIPLIDYGRELLREIKREFFRIGTFEEMTEELRLEIRKKVERVRKEIRHQARWLRELW